MSDLHEGHGTGVCDHGVVQWQCRCMAHAGDKVHAPCGDSCVEKATGPAPVIESDGVSPEDERAITEAKQRALDLFWSRNVPEDDEARQALNERMERSLTNQRPEPETIEKIEELRSLYKSLSHFMIGISEPGRELSLALTHLEDSCMWAVKGLVLSQDQ